MIDMSDVSAGMDLTQETLLLLVCSTQVRSVATNLCCGYRFEHAKDAFFARSKSVKVLLNLLISCAHGGITHQPPEITWL